MTGVYTAMGLKADKTYVDSGMTGVYTAMGLKADKTYVDTGMTGVYTSIGLKADKTYVDTTIRAISTNLDNYNTSNNNNFTNFGTSIANLTSFVNTKADKTYVDSGMTGIYTAMGLKADKTYVDSGMTGVYTAMTGIYTAMGQIAAITAAESESRDSSTFFEKNGANVIVSSNVVKVYDPRSVKGFFITSKTGHPQLKNTVPGIYRFNNVDTTLASYVPPKPVVELATGNINGTDGNFSGNVTINGLNKICINSTCINENNLKTINTDNKICIGSTCIDERALKTIIIQPLLREFQNFKNINNYYNATLIDYGKNTFFWNNPGKFVTVPNNGNFTFFIKNPSLLNYSVYQISFGFGVFLIVPEIETVNGNEVMKATIDQNGLITVTSSTTTVNSIWYLVQNN
jgi:TM2 domain-containing membrane protein YozV